MIETKIIRIDPFNINRDLLKEASLIIQKGGLVAFPTETVYGLGADVFNTEALKRIFAVKRRPMDNPLIIHICRKEDVYEVAEEVPKEATKLIEEMWPGPLTLILRKSKEIPYEATGGLETVAVRMPAHPVALEFICLSDTFIAAPSANISGRPSPTKAEHVIRDFYGIIEAIIDSGETLFGIESTILNVLTDPPTLLRPGAYPVELIMEILRREISIPPFAKGFGEADIALAPGTKYRHYAPNTPLILIESSNYSMFNLDKIVNEIFSRVINDLKSNKRVAVIASRETINKYRNLLENYENVIIIDIGSRSNLYEIAKRIFDTFRRLDDLGVDIAYIEGFEERGIGLSIMNRIRKAATQKIRI
ncbi:MAG: L-threonylcarbamoyladenylate synthase [Sulfolobales archaeon]